MKRRGFAITKEGREIIASLIAGGPSLVYSRVMAGSGYPPDDLDFSDMTDLAESRMIATSTVPVVKSGTVHMTAEVRSDLGGGLEEGFWLSELALFAIEPEAGEVLFGYASLGDYPEWIAPMGDESPVVRRYPLQIPVGEGITVVTGYSPDAFMTAADVSLYCTETLLPLLLEYSAEQIAVHNEDEKSHPVILEKLAKQDSEIELLRLLYFTDVNENTFMATFGSLENIQAVGVWNRAQQRIEF